MNTTQNNWKHSDMVDCISKALEITKRTKFSVEDALGSKFVQDFPHLTLMLSNPEADIEQLMKFVALSSSVASGTVDKDQADVAVGQELADQYLPTK